MLCGLNNAPLSSETLRMKCAGRCSIILSSPEIVFTVHHCSPSTENNYADYHLYYYHLYINCKIVHFAALGLLPGIHQGRWMRELKQYCDGYDLVHQGTAVIPRICYLCRRVFHMFNSAADLLTSWFGAFLYGIRKASVLPRSQKHCIFITVIS